MDLTRALRIAISPRFLFGLGILQALLPYLLWKIDGPNPRYSHVTITYIPLYLWLTAGIAFYCGTSLSPRPRGPAKALVLLPRLPLLYVLYFAFLTIIALQAALSVRIYGSLPILSYLAADGDIHVSAANQLQHQSGYGQFGLFLISLFAVHGLLLLICIYSHARRRLLPIAAVLPVPFILFAHVLNAKRQGIVMLFVFMLAGSTLVTGMPFRFLASLMRLGGSRWITWALAIGLIPTLLGVAGFLATIRTQGKLQTTGMEQYVSYLQFPLLNLEVQANKAGYGPSNFEGLGPMVTMIPFKSRPPGWQMPPKAERSSPSSILEHLHWFWGIWGIAAYMLVLGFAVQFVFQRTSSSLFYLLSYCQIAHALFVVHSSNLFLMLAYIPIPLIFFAVMTWLFGGRSRNCAIAYVYTPSPSSLPIHQEYSLPRPGMDSSRP